MAWSMAEAVSKRGAPFFVALGAIFSYYGSVVCTPRQLPELYSLHCGLQATTDMCNNIELEHFPREGPKVIIGTWHKEGREIRRLYCSLFSYVISVHYIVFLAML